ncbi:major capsid protein [Solidesulfovibrio sp.]
MSMLNPFDHDAFSLVSLTTSINLIPNGYGRLLRGNIFREKRITTTSVMIERQGNVLNLLPSKPRGGDASQSRHGKRDMLPLIVPHIPMEDVIRPGDFQGVREFGTENSLKTLASVMAGYLSENKRKFDITWEHLMWGAIKGLIIDGDGETVIEDLFDRFKIPQQVIFFDLDNPETDVAGLCRDLCRYIEENLFGDVATGVRVFVSKEFFDKLISHPNVEKFYLNQLAASELRSSDLRKGFTFSGVTFEEFVGRAQTSAGELIRFIEPGEGHAIPEGTMSTFEIALAPGEFIDTANTPGEWLYARQQMKDFNRGVDLWFESNPLPYCTRPNVLVKCDMGPRP